MGGTTFRVDEKRCIQHVFIHSVFHRGLQTNRRRHKAAFLFYPSLRGTKQSVLLMEEILLLIKHV